MNMDLDMDMGEGMGMGMGWVGNRLGRVWVYGCMVYGGGGGVRALTWAVRLWCCWPTGR